MKRFLTAFAVLALALTMAVPAFAGWYLSTNNDTTDATGTAVLIAPGASGQQFVLDRVFMDDANVGATDIKFTFAVQENANGYSAADSTAATDTDITITNTGSAAVLVAGDILYSHSGGTSDPNDGTLIYYGVVASTALSDEADQETAVIAEALTTVTTGATIFAARPFHVVTEVVAATDHDVVFGPNEVASYDTVSKIQSFPLSVVGRLNRDVLFMVNNATVPTVFDINLDGHYEPYRD